MRGEPPISPEEYGVRADGTYGRISLGNFTIAGDFKCERCMSLRARIDALHGVECGRCGNGVYQYDVVPSWMCRAIFRFADGRVETRFVDSRRPTIWQLIDRADGDDCSDIGDLIIKRRTFRRRDFAAGYGFIGPTTDSDYVEEP